MRTVTTTREYDAEGRLVKEVVVEMTTPEPYIAPAPQIPTTGWPLPPHTFPQITSVTAPSPALDYVAVN